MSVCPAKNIPAASASTGEAPAELAGFFVAYLEVEIVTWVYDFHNQIHQVRLVGNMGNL